MKKATTRKYIVNSNIFLDENDISFYLLGAYMTDGNICDTKHHLSFSLKSKDFEWIESIKNTLCPTKPIYFSKESDCCSIDLSDMDSMNWLMSYGCTPCKSKTLKLAKDIPTKYHADFIRGLIDGDGSISYAPYTKTKKGKIYHYTKLSVYLCSASKEFLDQIKLLIPPEINCYIYNLGKRNSIIRGKEIKATCDIYRLCFNDSYAKKLLAYLYYPEHKLSMKRKEQLSK